MVKKMLTWVQFPEDLKIKINTMIYDIDWFFEYFYNEVVLPSKNESLKQSFSDFFDLIYDACSIYRSIEDDVVSLEKMINYLNHQEEIIDESSKFFSLMEDVVNDLNITYLNVCILFANDAFTYKPIEITAIKERIKELDNKRDKLIPLVQNMAKERTNFDKYLIELSFLNEKLKAQQSN